MASLFINAYATEYMHKMQGVVLVDDFTTDEDADTWRVMRKCADQGKELSPLNIYAVGKDMGIEVDVRRYTTSESIFADSETLGKALHAVGQRRRYANQVEDAYITLLYDPDTTTEQVIAQIDKATKDTISTSDQNCESFGEVYRTLLQVTQDKANGKIPEGYIIKFKDGDFMNCDIDNLYIMSRADACVKMTSEQSPEQIKKKMSIVQARRNELIRKDKMRIRWGLEPKSKIVKRYYAK